MADALPENIRSTKVFEVWRDSVANKRLPKRDEKQYEDLKSKLLNKTAEVGVLGLGYVGLPLTMAFADAGYRVTGFDKDERKIKAIKEGTSYIQDVPSEDVAKHSKAERFVAYSNFAKLADCDVVVICVPTPLAKTKDPDMSFIMSALNEIEISLRSGQLVILESTTYPGTTREILLPSLENARGKKHKVGKDFFLAFSPERVDPGNEKYNVKNTPKVVGGVTKECGELASVFYSQVMEHVVQVSSPESAEMVKLLENTFRSVNIGLVNEVAIMCERLGVDCWEVIEAASTKPFGYMPFYPGPGLGGHCIPIDPSYLSWKLRSLNYTAQFIELANTINTSMPEFVETKIAHALNKDKKAINGSKVLMLGVAYKKNIEDMRESPALSIIHLLQKQGAQVDYYDSYVPDIGGYEGINLKSVRWSDDLASKYDCVVITTDHTNVNYGAVVKNAKRIVDTRNALASFHNEKITKL